MCRLTDVKARNLIPGIKPLQHGEVSGLRLELGASPGISKWILRFVSPHSGKRRDMGLGRYPDVGLADAAQLALDARKVIASGEDPLEQRALARKQRDNEVATLTFQQAAQRVHVVSKSSWKNGRHVDHWINSLRSYRKLRSATGSAPKSTQATPADR